MNLEPIIQSEVTQKEKDKYCVLMHIHRIQKNGTNNLFTGQQWRNRPREQTYGHGESGGEGEMQGKSNMETYITICKVDSQFAVWLRKLKQGLYPPRVLGWGGKLEGGSKRWGYMYTCG